MMNTKTAAGLQARLAASRDDSAQQLSLTFLQAISARQQALHLSNAELARRMGTSPAYITRLYQTSANLSLDTMVRLAAAMGSQIRVGVEDQRA